MKKTLPALLGGLALALAAVPGLAANPAHQQAAQTDTAAGPWTAYGLRTQCRDQDPSEHAQCRAAVRGILHGYRYGVVYLGEHARLPEAQMKRIVVCINALKLDRVISDFLDDSAQVMDTSLQRTPAEMALLGSLQVHQGCT